MADTNSILIKPGTPKKIREKYIPSYLHSREDFVVYTALFVLGSTAAVIFVILGLFTGKVFGSLLFAPLVAHVAYRSFKRLNFVSDANKYMLYLNDIESNFARNIFRNLLDVKSTYYKNLQAIPEQDRYKVALDEETLEDHLWNVAMDLKRLAHFYDQPRSKISRTGDLLETALHEIRAEVQKLEEAVQNLVDIAIIDSVSEIKDHYIDPTAADTLSQITRTRLGALKELNPAPAAPASKKSLKEQEEYLVSIAKKKNYKHYTLGNYQYE